MSTPQATHIVLRYASTKPGAALVKKYGPFSLEEADHVAMCAIEKYWSALVVVVVVPVHKGAK